MSGFEMPAARDISDQIMRDSLRRALRNRVGRGKEVSSAHHLHMLIDIPTSTIESHMDGSVTAGIGNVAKYTLHFGPQFGTEVFEPVEMALQWADETERSYTDALNDLEARIKELRGGE